MNHLLVLTKIQETEVELTDEEYEEYLKDKASYLDPYWGELDTVETQVEHFEQTP